MAKTELQQKFFETGSKLGWWRTGIAFDYYCRRQLFREVPVKDKRVLDIGCGDGRYALWSAVEGAGEAVGLEPCSDGSSGSQAVKECRSAIAALQLRNACIEEKRLQALNGHHGQWDIMLLHAAINHLDEAACIALCDDPEAWGKYLVLARQIRSLCRTGGFLIIADVARRNLFGDLGWRNPWAPTIEWHKHQQPETWARLFIAAGFCEPRISWISNSVWGPLGSLQRNRSCAYLRDSYFRLLLRANGARQEPV
jgi:SAM-dependent methyltransferase